MPHLRRPHGIAHSSCLCNCGEWTRMMMSYYQLEQKQGYVPCFLWKDTAAILIPPLGSFFCDEREGVRSTRRSTGGYLMPLSGQWADSYVDLLGRSLWASYLCRFRILQLNAVPYQRRRHLLHQTRCVSLRFGTVYLTWKWLPASHRASRQLKIPITETAHNDRKCEEHVAINILFIMDFVFTRTLNGLFPFLSKTLLTKFIWPFSFTLCSFETRTMTDSFWDILLLHLRMPTFVHDVSPAYEWCHDPMEC